MVLVDLKSFQVLNQSLRNNFSTNYWWCLYG